MSNRGMLEMIQANHFFSSDEVEKYAAIGNSLPFTEKPYGMEVDNFNVILENIEPIMSKVLGSCIVTGKQIGRAHV